jgi:NodT family efflux transporter outer membrane factor (OMF) lipoprotein
LTAEIALNYVELCAARTELALTRANLAVQKDTLDIVHARASSELATDFDVARAESQVATTRALLPELEVRASEALHRIGVLVGKEPNALARELAGAAAIPTAPVVGAVGVPSDLLRRRADVRRAERELAQAAALTAQATAELFPRLSLSAALGVQSSSLSRIFDGDSGTFSVGPSLTAPIFASGALRANVRAQGAREEQALALYEQAALVALLEVEDALVAQDRERVRLASLQEAHAAARRALEISRALNSEGLVDFFEVLDAQRAALVTETAVAQSEAALCADTIALYKALGGGWQE